MAFADYADLAARYDVRELLQLASDTGEAENEADLPGNAVVATALDDASAAILAALAAGGRYSESELGGLEGYSASLLKRTTCEVAVVFLMERRPDLNRERLEAYERVRERHLNRLRKGENVFALPQVVAAGQPSHSGPTAASYARLNLIRDNAEGHYYPRRRIPE